MVTYRNVDLSCPLSDSSRAELFCQLRDCSAEILLFFRKDFPQFLNLTTYHVHIMNREYEMLTILRSTILFFQFRGSLLYYACCFYSFTNDRIFLFRQVLHLTGSAIVNVVIVNAA